MATWIVDHNQKEIPSLPLPLAFRLEADLERYLCHHENARFLFGFRLWTSQYRIRRGNRYRVDLIGYSEQWEHGYVIELKIGQIKASHFHQVRRYVALMRKCHSWGESVAWHPLVIACTGNILKGAWA